MLKIVTGRALSRLRLVQQVAWPKHVHLPSKTELDLVDFELFD